MKASTSDRRQALAEIARARRGGSAGRLLRRAAVAIALAAALAAITSWLLGFFHTPAEVLAVRALVDAEVETLRRVARNEAPLSYESESRGAIIDTMRQVPEPYRDQARRELGRLPEAREAAEVDSFFSLPAAQRGAELDRRIRAEEARRQAWAAERARRTAERETEPGRGGAAAAGTDGGGPGRSAASPATTGGGGWSSGSPGRGTEEGRNLRAKWRIDRSTAESRARRLEYQRLKEQRRIQLGLGQGR